MTKVELWHKLLLSPLLQFLASSLIITIHDYQLFLFIYFAQQGISYSQLRINIEIAVYSQRVGVCIPDLVVFLEELATVMQGAKRSLVLPDMPPPLLVVEVVSPNQRFDTVHCKENRAYWYKRYCSVMLKRPDYTS